ncbi:MAG: histidine kinase [Gaiellaceae bacterium MAG52_C11]|nr:histidine kinase [Candidatus Gaiellasilicea maunaloa]
MSAQVAIWITLAIGLLAGAAAYYLIVTQRRRDEAVKRENARLLADAVEREGERSRLADRIITAEQDERRRLALFLHDGPVQNLSGIALMIDAAVHAIEDGRGPDALGIIGKALEKHRETIRSLRDLSFNIEPIVLRDQGLVPAVLELANQLGIEHAVQIEVDVEQAERLGEKEQVGLYQIIRESLNQALLRGPPTRISVTARRSPDGGLEAVIADNGKGERRLRALDAIQERVTTLNGRFAVEQVADGGTALHVLLPPYATGT